MSWSTIAAALQARISAVDGVGKAHSQIRYDDEGFDDEQFRELFLEEDGGVNTWQITRTGRTAQRSPDNSRITKVQHQVTVRANLSLVDPGTGEANTEDDFQALLDAVCDDLDVGDRTLGAAAITHSVPQAGQIGYTMFYGSVLCHDAILTFTVEENRVSGSLISFTPNVSPESGLESVVEKIGTALIAWFAPRVTSLGLVSFEWHPHMRGAPTYPADPRAHCPRAFLRVSRVGHSEGAGGIGCNTAGMVLQLSIWLQLRQTPGEAHQRRIVAGLDIFQTALLQSGWRFEGMDVDQLYDLVVKPAEGVVYDELEHPLGDPALRVSSGETSLLLEGKIRSG